MTKSLAASFQGDILRKKIKGCGNNLKNSTNLIESPATGKLIKTPVKTVFKSCDAETNTEDVFFIVLAKLDQGEEVFVEEQILSSDRNRFQCAAAFQRKKMLKLMYDKSTSTEDLVEVRCIFNTVLIFVNKWNIKILSKRYCKNAYSIFLTRQFCSSRHILFIRFTDVVILQFQSSVVCLFNSLTW